MPQQIQAVCIGKINGPPEETNAFLDKLAEELKSANFKVVDKNTTADGILQGSLSVQGGKFGGNIMLALEKMGTSAIDNDGNIKVTIKLVDTAGNKLWGGNFQRTVRSAMGADLARIRAKDVMKKFLRDFEPAQPNP